MDGIGNVVDKYIAHNKACVYTTTTTSNIHCKMKRDIRCSNSICTPSYAAGRYKQRPGCMCHFTT